jgi:HEAT repeat protein
MSCPDLDLLSPLLDGELPPDEAKAAREHLDRCPECAARFEELAGLDRLLVDSLAPRATTGRGRVLPLALAGALAAAGLLLFVWSGRSSRPASAPPVEPAPRVEAAPPTLAERVGSLLEEEMAGGEGVARRLRALGLGARRPLRETLKDRDADRVRSALRLIVAVRDRAAVPSVAAVLEREDLAVDAARALASLGRPEALPALAAAFRDGGPAGALADSIVEIGGRDAARTLEDLLGGEDDPDRRDLLLRTVGKLPPGLAAPLLASRIEEPTAREILERRRDEMIPALRSELIRGNREVAARVLGALGDAGSRSRIMALLEVPELRGAAARGLAALGDEDSLRVLLDAIRDDTDDPAVDAFVEAGPSALRLLTDRFENGRHEERRLAVRLLGRRGGDVAVSALERALGDPALFGGAIEALGRAGRESPRAIDVLARAGRTPALRSRAVRALGETGRSEAVPALVSLAVDRGTTRLVLAALARIPGDESVRAVREFLGRPRCEREARRALRKLAPENVPDILARRRKSVGERPPEV